MAIFAATELDRFAADILESRGVSGVFSASTAGDTTDEAQTVNPQECASIPRVA